LRAAAYIRVSTEDQARHGYSLDAQREACRRRALEVGAQTVAEYADEGVSGATLERPGLAALREACRAGVVDLVVCLDPDRLSRKLAHQMLLTEEFERAGVRLEFVNFDWQNTPDGRLFYALRGAIAEYEREKIKERTLSGKRQKARSGMMPIGAVPYGYRLESGRLVAEPAEAEAVRLAFDLFLREDLGVNGVAARLTALGVPTRGGRPWNRATVRGMLRNPVYAGTFLYRQGGEVIPVPVPALVEPETWTNVQEKLAEARRLWSGWSREKYLLSGLVTCADCGCTMHGAVRRGRKGGRGRSYTCVRTQAGRLAQGCRPVKYVDADTLEAAAWERVTAWLDDPAAFARELRDGGRVDELARDLARVREHLAAARKGVDNIRRALAGGLLDLDEGTAAALKDARARERALLARKKELERELAAARASEKGAREMLGQAKRWLKELDTLGFNEKKALVRVLVRQVIVRGRGRDVEATLVANLGAADEAEKPGKI
jgi:site-specific DNA recombinase